jgi:elongation factor Tu
MVVDDSFALTTAGEVVVVGVIAEGEIRPGDTLVVQTRDSTIPVTAEAIEAFHKPLDHAKAGDRVGVKLDGATKEDVGPGDVLTNVE